MKKILIKFAQWLLGLFGESPTAEIHEQLSIAATADLPPDDPKYVPLVPGQELEVAGRKLVFAPLNATAVKQYREEIKSVSIGSVPDVEIVSKLAYASLLRNYPSITLQVVDDMIDYSNVFAVWETVINLTGLMVQAGELARRVEKQMQAGGLTT